MKKIREMLIAVLSVACVLSAMGAVACGQGQGQNVNSVAQKVIYYVGTNIDLFELFETQQGYTYTFEVGEKGNSTKTVMGRFFYAEKSGEYTARLTGVKGGNKQTGTADFTVSDTLPFMAISGSAVKMNYNSFIDIDRLINIVNIFIVSDSDVEYAIEKVVFFKNHYVTEGEEIIITKGTPAGNGFYDGDNKLTFNKEGVYDFYLSAKNAGGSAEGTFSVSVAENVSGYVNLGEPNYDKDSKIASWNAVEGASFYRVKIDYENVITDQTTIDISDYLIPEANGFQN